MTSEKIRDTLRAAMDAHANQEIVPIKWSDQPIDRNCLSYWFPVLEKAGVPVPRTEIVKTDIRLIELCDGTTPDGFDAFYDELLDAINRIGGNGPWFFRTGQGSGKHEWKRTCFLTGLSDLQRHIAALVEWSEMVDFLGLRTDCWVVREMLPTKPVAVLDRYGNFPLVKEVRGFIGDGKILCVHPYWPQGAVREGNASRDDDLSDMWFRAALPTEDDERACRKILQIVADAFNGDGSWSIDVLATASGEWFVTDMADAGRSFHWPECPRIAV